MVRTLSVYFFTTNFNINTPPLPNTHTHTHTHTYSFQEGFSLQVSWSQLQLCNPHWVLSSYIYHISSKKDFHFRFPDHNCNYVTPIGFYFILNSRSKIKNVLSCFTIWHRIPLKTQCAYCAYGLDWPTVPCRPCFRVRRRGQPSVSLSICRVAVLGGSPHQLTLNQSSRSGLWCGRQTAERPDPRVSACYVPRGISSEAKTLGL